MPSLMKRIMPFAAVIGAAILLLGVSGYPPIRAFQILVNGSWGSVAGLALLLTKSMPLMLTGLAVVIPFRAGLFNIGGEGQLYLGAVTAAIVGTCDWGLPVVFHVPLTVGIGVAAGAFWGAFAGYLRAKRGVHEVIGTILLNFIALYLVNYLALGPLSAGEGIGRTAFIAPSARLVSLPFPGNNEVSTGLFIAIGCALLCQWFLRRTQAGWNARAIGENPVAAEYAGIPIHRYMVGVMAFGGGLAGLAGALETSGVQHTFFARFTSSYGFDGIAVAFMAQAEPWAVIPAALFLATLRTADRALQFELGVPREMVLILEGVLIVLVAVLHQRERARRLRRAAS